MSTKQNSNGETALILMAASYGHERVTELLLQYGAETDKQSSTSAGVSALNASRGHNHDLLL